MPCGQCIGCRLDRSRHWAIRCMHEAKMHDQNSFITLTYEEDNLPQYGSLKLKHWQDFMKRLRKRAAKLGMHRLKFMHCGEYGEQFKRPHYHALIFGFDVPDRKVWKVSDSSIVYSSAFLDDVWGHGFTSVGDVTYESAAYVARYTMKKVNGALARKVDPETGLAPYERICPYTLQINEVDPEYSTQSRNPGIGKSYLEKFGSDVYPWDEVIVNGFPQRPPRFYDNQYELDNPESMEEIRQERVAKMEKYASDNTRARLATKEKVKKAQVNLLKRDEVN